MPLSLSFRERLMHLCKLQVTRLPDPWGPLILESFYVRWLSPGERAVRRKLREHDRDLLRQLGRPRRVMQGPFAGMRYITINEGAQMLPKFLGTYEKELMPTVETMIAGKPDVLIDIGAAEGYYAVGLARRLPETRIITYDISAHARYLMLALARMNSMKHRIESRGLCTSQTLETDLASATRPVVICDCEGTEDQLLRPDLTPSLKKTSILVEVHDLYIHGLWRRLSERFEPTHHITDICTQYRTRADLPAGCPLSDEQVQYSMWEGRPVPMHWYWLTPRKG